MGGLGERGYAPGVLYVTGQASQAVVLLVPSLLLKILQLTLDFSVAGNPGVLNTKEFKPALKSLLF